MRLHLITLGRGRQGLGHSGPDGFPQVGGRSGWHRMSPRGRCAQCGAQTPGRRWSRYHSMLRDTCHTLSRDLMRDTESWPAPMWCLISTWFIPAHILASLGNVWLLFMDGVRLMLMSVVLTLQRTRGNTSLYKPHCQALSSQTWLKVKIFLIRSSKGAVRRFILSYILLPPLAPKALRHSVRRPVFAVHYFISFRCFVHLLIFLLSWI